MSCTLFLLFLCFPFFFPSSDRTTSQVKRRSTEYDSVSLCCGSQEAWQSACNLLSSWTHATIADTSIVSPPPPFFFLFFPVTRQQPSKQSVSCRGEPYTQQPLYICNTLGTTLLNSHRCILLAQLYVKSSKRGKPVPPVTFADETISQLNPACRDFLCLQIPMSHSAWLLANS